VDWASAHDAVNYDGYPEWWIWWLEHGLDGVAGGALGGIIAVAGVAVTLAYDRKKRREDRTAQRQSENEAVIRRILEKAVDANSEVRTPDGWRRFAPGTLKPSTGRSESPSPYSINFRSWADR
jgi:hypothetical protein